MTAISLETNFCRRLDGLRQQLISAQSHRNIIADISNLSANYSHEIDRAPYFFRMSFHAHVLSTVIRLYTFFDKPYNLSMFSLFDFVDNNLPVLSEEAYRERLKLSGDSDRRIRRLVADRPQITADTVKQHRTEIDRLPSKNLTIWRHNLLAHVNLNTVLEQKAIGTAYPIVWAEIDAILKSLYCILNTYYHAYNASSFSLMRGYGYEMKEILEAVRSDQAPKRRQAQRLLKETQLQKETKA